MPHSQGFFMNRINSIPVLKSISLKSILLTWTCSPCEFTIEPLPLRRRPLPCMGHKGFIYLFIYLLLDFPRGLFSAVLIDIYAAC